MRTYHLHETTTATPAQFLAGLTDFGPGRQKIFGSSGDEFLEVHALGVESADVTEGTGSRGHAVSWERLYYDWSDPSRVTMKVLDSNVVREGKNVKGRVLALVVSTIGKRSLAKALHETVKAIEARSYVEAPDERKLAVA